MVAKNAAQHGIRSTQLLDIAVKTPDLAAATHRPPVDAFS